MLLIIPEQRNVVHFVFLTLGRLPVLCKKLLLRIIIHIFDVVHVEATFTGLLAISSHIEPADKLLSYIFRHLFESVFFHLFQFLSVLIRCLNKLIQNLIHVGFVFDVENTSGGSWRYGDIDFCVSFDESQIAHEVTEFAECLCFFKAELGKPGTEHIDGIVSLRKGFLQEGNHLIPLLPMKDLSNSMPQGLILVDFLLTDRFNVGFFVSFSKLIVVEPVIVELFDKEKRPLMEVCLIKEHLFPFFFVTDLTFKEVHFLVLNLVHMQLIEVMGKFTMLSFHDAKSSQEISTVGCLFEILVFLHVFSQFFLVVGFVDRYDCIFGR